MTHPLLSGSLIGTHMRYVIGLAILFAFIIPGTGTAEQRPSVTIAADGFPTGQETPEGAAADFARAFIAKDPAAFKRISVRIYNEGPSGKDYEAFLVSVASNIASEQTRAIPSPNAPKEIGKVFAVRHLSGGGPASYGYAAFGFQDVAFVDVGVVQNDGQRMLNRTLMIQDRDGKWYVHPAPEISPLLSHGLNAESPSTIDFPATPQATQ
jgi:hypothetical protein